MAAPDATLLAALRSYDRPARHLFFKMGHSQGTVRAWDGLGDRVFGGETYTGIGNMANISGISRSRDLQTPEVVVTLSGVPYAALQSIDPSIRNETATITAVWYSETGTLIASKVLFTGLGNFLTSSFGDRTLSITAHLRGRMADWSRAPQSFYTSQDQQRLYPGDTGFDYVKSLESTTVSGWGLYKESTGATITRIGGSTATLFDSLQNRVMGTDEGGAYMRFAGVAPLTVGPCGFASNFVTETTAVAVLYVAAPDYETYSGGVVLYVDIDSDARSNLGKRILRTGATSTNRLRAATEITSQGVATATTFGVSNTFVGVTGSVYTSTTTNPSSWLNAAFCNAGGGLIESGGVILSFFRGFTTGSPIALVEETTGNAVTLSGGLVKCNGANVVLSTTGVLLTSSNKRVHPTGKVASVEFARIWTT